MANSPVWVSGMPGRSRMRETLHRLFRDCHALEVEERLLVSLRMLLPPELKQQRVHARSHHLDAVHLRMTAGAKRDHEREHGSSRYAVMDDDRAFPPSRRLATTAAVTITLEYRLSQAPEIPLILPP